MNSHMQFKFILFLYGVYTWYSYNVSIVHSNWSNFVVSQRKQTAKPLVKFIFAHMPSNFFHVDTVDKGMRLYLTPFH